MPDSNFTSEHNAPHNWLSDLQPVFAAQQSWESGAYRQVRVAHLQYVPDTPFVVACGASSLAEHIRVFRITPEVITKLGQVTDAQGRSLFRESFLNHLQRLKLRVQVNMPPEGSLLLPGAPLLIVQGPDLHIRLMESAFNVLVWAQTHRATQSAWLRWQQNNLLEEDTPPPPAFPPNPVGWNIRAAYIGGASADEILENMRLPVRPMLPQEGVGNVEKEMDDPLVQIRRLFKGEQPLADLWLSRKDEEMASDSKNRIWLKEMPGGQLKEINMTRFQNLYQPVLVKGHPALPVQRLAYLRQRTFKQFNLFRETGIDNYPFGWAATQPDIL
ncbi:MAG: hypothetical protein LCH81_19475 [Bacteroidetes bacterium]|nr:hypothetical protein [Bacteroidota bacterium]